MMSYQSMQSPKMPLPQGQPPAVPKRRGPAKGHKAQKDKEKMLKLQESGQQSTNPLENSESRDESFMSEK